MARTTIKSTYSLDEPTIQALDRLTRRWNVSKSEAMRRAILAADQRPEEGNDRLAAFRELQRLLNLTPAQADAWAREARDLRRATSERMERRRS